MPETLDIIQLRTFVAIDECGGFGRAASALHMSQPTVSQHVRSLERRLSQQLVERDGRKARFTLAGSKLLAEARRILAVHDEALARLDVTRSSTIVVGSTETAAEQVLPELLRRLHAAYPERQVQFHIDRSTQMTEAVAKGTIDLAIVLDTGQTISGPEVGSLPLNWYASPGWTPPADDEAVPLVAYVEPCGMRQRALGELNARGRRVEIAAESGSLEGVIAAARAGLGVAVLPSAGKAPAGLVARHDFPDLGQIFVRLITRRGLDADVEEAALEALDGFFAVRGYVHAVSA
ncbi:MAG: LysR family transcriptional regulator [Microbacterium sp.]|uniref:LysR family transcriptional regulator n=1 Tax=Microbacterium sp. TaxID=51671 RepID=UPI0039E46B48